MLTDPHGLISDYQEALRRCGESIPDIAHELLPATHRPPRLPLGMCAVYVFSLSAAAGDRCPAGPHRVLKVGKVGPNSNARFQSQHYNPASAGSTLAATLLNARLLWTYLGFPGGTSILAGGWLMEHTDRDHFFLEASDLVFLGEFERYVRGRHSPVFEGG